MCGVSESVIASVDNRYLLGLSSPALLRIIKTDSNKKGEQKAKPCPEMLSSTCILIGTRCINT